MGEDKKIQINDQVQDVKDEDLQKVRGGFTRLKSYVLKTFVNPFVSYTDT